LKRNADQQFYIFKSEEDVAQGTIYKSGKYTLTFNYGGPNRLTLDYDNSEQIVEYPTFVHDGAAFTQLLYFFPRVDKSDASPEVVNTLSNKLVDYQYSSKIQSYNLN